MTAPTLTTYALPMQRDVALFHDVFGHPNRIAAPGPLPLERINLRIKMLREEGVTELAQAIGNNDIIGVIDALIDTVYVALGTLVEMGMEADSRLLRRCTTETTSSIELLPVLASMYLATNEEQLNNLEAALRSQRTHASGYLLTAMTGKALRVLRRAGIDPQPFFDEVQRANLSKLGADGKPIHSRGIDLDGYPAGKVLKGPNYVPPNLHAVYERLYGNAVSLSADSSQRAPKLYALVSIQGTAMSETVLTEAEFTPENQRRIKNNAPADWDGGDFRDVSGNEALRETVEP